MVVETYALKIPKYKMEIEAPDEDAVSRLRAPLPGWTLEHDVAMVKLMSQHLPPDNEQLGTIKNYVESIDVSSFCVSTKFFVINKNIVGLCMAWEFSKNIH